jgi:cardiolipin synthase A/B
MAEDRAQLGPFQRCFGAAFLLLCGACSAVPDVDGLVDRSGSGSSRPQIVGAHGPLTAKQSRLVLARLELDAPNTDVLARHLALEDALANSPLVVGNKVTLLRDSAATLAATFRAIREAKDHINLEYYIVEDVEQDGERLSDLLIEKQRQGVQVNLIYDGVGSISTPSDFFGHLDDAGIGVLEFHPVGQAYAINDRDHRKILIADGRVALIGGVNLSSVYASAPLSSGSATGPWQDSDMQIEGPAVAELQKLFIATWTQEDGAPFPVKSDFFPRIDGNGKDVVRVLGSTPDHEVPQYYVSLLSAIRNAENRIWITAAYFVPTAQELDDLVAAAKRGVDVRLLLPSRSDNELPLLAGRSHYERLLKAGVKIYEYRAAILHSKAVVIDGVWSVLGSSNFDHRSVLFNNEVDAVVLGAETATQMEAMFDDELTRAAPVDEHSWRQRPVAERLREFFARAWEVLL